MLKNILNLEGVTLLNKEEQRHVGGGKYAPVGETCKATCSDGSLVTVASCSNSSVACSTSGGFSSCKCDYPSPLDPPK